METKLSYKITLFGSRGGFIVEALYSNQEDMYNDCLRLAHDYPDAAYWQFDGEGAK